MYQLGPLPQPEGKTGSIREKPPSAVRIEVVIVMCALTGSNRRPAGCKPAALPAELKALNCSWLKAVLLSGRRQS